MLGKPILPYTWIAGLLTASLLQINYGPFRTYRLYPSVVFPERVTLALVARKDETGKKTLFLRRPLDPDSLMKWQLAPRAPSLAEADTHIRNAAALFPQMGLSLLHRTVVRLPQDLIVQDEELTLSAR